MLGFRRERWWHREIERIRRENAARERDLIATICRLSGRPQPDEWKQPAAAPPADTDDDRSRSDLEDV